MKDQNLTIQKSMLKARGWQMMVSAASGFTGSSHAHRLLRVCGCFHRTVTASSGCHRNHVAHEAWSIYYQIKFATSYSKSCSFSLKHILSTWTTEFWKQRMGEWYRSNIRKEWVNRFSRIEARHASLNQYLTLRMDTKIRVSLIHKRKTANINRGRKKLKGRKSGKGKQLLNDRVKFWISNIMEEYFTCIIWSNLRNYFRSRYNITVSFQQWRNWNHSHTANHRQSKGLNSGLLGQETLRFPILLSYLVIVME